MWCVGEIRTIVERYQERYNGASGAQRQTLAEDVAQVLLQHVDKIGQPALLEKIRSDLPAVSREQYCHHIYILLSDIRNVSIGGRII